MEDNAKVTLEMRVGKFTCAVKTLDGINNTLRMIKMPDGFKDALKKDVESVKDIITSSRKG